MASCQQEFDPGTPADILEDFIRWEKKVMAEAQEILKKAKYSLKTSQKPRDNQGRE